MSAIGTTSQIFLGVTNAYLLWQQNRILEKQTRAFLQQGPASKMSAQVPSRVRRFRHYWPLLAMAALTLLTWLAIVYGPQYWHRGGQHIVEFDSPQAGPVIVEYGLDPISCFQEVRSTEYLSMEGKYKLATACFIYDGSVPILDAPSVQVSNLYDIINGNVTMRILFGDAFNRYRAEHHASGIDIALLLVPNGVSPSQFSTLRQARALGVLIPFLSIGSTRPGP